MPQCTSCGRRLDAEGRRCPVCGAPQADPWLLISGLPAPSARAPARVGAAPRAVPPPRPSVPGWAVVVIVLAVLGAAGAAASLVVPVLLAGGSFAFVSGPAPAQEPVAGVREGVRAIQDGVETWRTAHDSDVYPAEAEVAPGRLGQFVDPWPRNPFTGGPMLPTGARGDYTYVRAADGLSYELSGFGADGTPVISLP